PADFVLRRPRLFTVTVVVRCVRVVAHVVLHEHRNPQVNTLPDRNSEEARFRYADHSHRRAVDANGFANDRRIARKPPIPERMAQHHDRVTAYYLIVLPADEPSPDRSHS